MVKLFLIHHVLLRFSLICQKTIGQSLLQLSSSLFLEKDVHSILVSYFCVIHFHTFDLLPTWFKCLWAWYLGLVWLLSVPCTRSLWRYLLVIQVECVITVVWRCWHARLSCFALWCLRFTWRDFEPCITEATVCVSCNAFLCTAYLFVLLVILTWCFSVSSMLWRCRFSYFYQKTLFITSLPSASQV